MRAAAAAVERADPARLARDRRPMWAAAAGAAGVARSAPVRMIVTVRAVLVPRLPVLGGILARRVPDQPERSHDGNLEDDEHEEERPAHETMLPGERSRRKAYRARAALSAFLGTDASKL